MPTHMTGEVAVAPGGRRSERASPEPLTFQGSFPLTTEAPPVSFQPGWPASKDPPGASW
jgi:hypothetical protein